MSFWVFYKFLSHKWIEWAIMGSMLIVVGMILFAPDNALIKRVSNHAFEAVVLFIASAMVFMVLKRPRIMFTCLAMGMILSLYLKQKSKSGIQSFFYSTNDQFSVCQVLINAGSDQYENISKRVNSSNAGIIHLQELTPDWQEVFKNTLESRYKYHAGLNRIDPYGMSIYSLYPIQQIDTLFYTDTLSNYPIPALKLVLNIHGHEVDFIACHLLPRLNYSDFSRVQGFMDMLSNWVQNNGHRTIIISGELGLTPWDYTLQGIISRTGLQVSKREPHLFVQPFEHILYSANIECHELKEVLAVGRNHIGVQGEYSFINIKSN